MNILEVLKTWLPSGKIEGEDYVVKNPTRNDKKAGSFRININSGAYIDHATGDKGTDIYGLYAYINHTTYKEACKALDKTPEPTQQQSFILPIPSDVNPPNNDMQWTYKDKDGNTLFYVARKETGRGKEFRPFAYTKQGWVNKMPIKTNVPLYNLDKLCQHKDKPVLIVEGEKTADAAQKIYPDYVVVTWCGGANSVSKADWKPLKNRKVLMWPDNDMAGQQAYAKVKGVLKNAEVVDLSKLRLPDKWDLADEPFDVDLPIDPAILTKVPSKKNKEIAFMDMDEKGRVLPTVDNYKKLFKEHEFDFRYNMLTHTIELTCPEFPVWDGGLGYECVRAEMYDRCIRYSLPYTQIDNLIAAFASEKRYHPALDWVLSKPCTNPSIITEFLSLLKTTNDELSRVLLYRWMLSGIGVLLNKGDFMTQGVLVLHGDQGIGKTRFINSLAPSWVVTGAFLYLASKDSVMQAIRSWIYEIGEIDGTFRKTDIAQLKAFVTRPVDTYRPPYGRNEISQPRRTIFAATINSEQFLADETGNRRWWTISLTKPINLKHGLDMQQVWRAFYDLYQKGEHGYLTKEEAEQLKEHNTNHEMADPLLEAMATGFHWDEPASKKMSATQIIESLGYPNHQVNKALTTKVGLFLKNNNIKKHKTMHGAIYEMPRRKYQ